jgi:hypothetical protein
LERNGACPFRVLKTAGASPLHLHKNLTPFTPDLTDGILWRGFYRLRASMQVEETIFEINYRNYLKQTRGMDLESLAEKLGATLAGNALKIQFIHDDYLVSAEKPTDMAGNKASYDICVILCKYILLCPKEMPQNKNWVSVKDFKDTALLVNYFSHDAECLAMLGRQLSSSLRKMARHEGNTSGQRDPS